MLGRVIQEHRTGKQLTQAQLGTLIGVKQSAIAMYENNYLTPPTQKIIKLARVLNIPPAELFDCVIADSPVESSPVPSNEIDTVINSKKIVRFQSADSL